MPVKLEWLRYPTVKKNYDAVLSRFHLVPERNGRTDGQTDLLSRVSMLTRDKNGVYDKYLALFRKRYKVQP